MTRATFNLIEFDEIDLARQIEFGSTHFAELPTEARQLATFHNEESGICQSLHLQEMSLLSILSRYSFTKQL